MAEIKKIDVKGNEVEVLMSSVIGLTFGDLCQMIADAAKLPDAVA